MLKSGFTEAQTISMIKETVSGIPSARAESGNVLKAESQT